MEKIQFFYDPTREYLLATLFLFAGLYKPLYSWWSEKHFPKRLFLTRALLLLGLIPPLVWGASEGRIGSRIHINDDQAKGFSITKKWMGGVDLKGVSLKLVQSHRYGKMVETLIGAKKGEHLRVDGFIDAERKSFSAVIRERYGIPVEESVALPER
ncbi:MAG: hypothetical protein WA705_22175 [Candidatus Ozemobacteraceae bacterium]